MGYLVLFLLMVIAVLSVMCWAFFSKMDEQAAQIVQVRKQLDQYLSDDTRALDMLWNRAQMETERVMQSRHRSS